jgi:hypothetical protein
MRCVTLVQATERRRRHGQHGGHTTTKRTGFVSRVKCISSVRRTQGSKGQSTAVLVSCERTASRRSAQGTRFDKV